MVLGSRETPNGHTDAQMSVFNDFRTLRVVPVDPILSFRVGWHPCSIAPVLLRARSSHVPSQLADRAFGAQRFSDGRFGRRFAPPSASGSAPCCHGATFYSTLLDRVMDVVLPLGC